MVAVPSAATSQAQAHGQLAGREVVPLLFPLVLARFPGGLRVGDAFLDLRSDAPAAGRGHGRPVSVLSPHFRGLLEPPSVAARGGSRASPGRWVRATFEVKF